MNNKKDMSYAKNLLQEFKKNKCTEEENATVQRFYIYGQVQTTALSEIELQQSVNRVIKRSQKTKKLSWPVSILFVAATLAIVGSLWAVLFVDPTNLPTQYSNDINPGGNKAVLTLSNGKKIQLNDSKTGIVIDATKLTYSDGTIITNGASGKITITTPRGGTYQARLPDGSTVWLNSASSLTYSKSKVDGIESRRVNLIGEAYFEVLKDKQRPFVVTTRKQVITVLGTHFNISSYENQAADKTTLLEGSVRVELIADSGKVMSTRTEILKPGEQAVTLGSQIQVAHPDPKIASSWKEGEFCFLNENLEDILKEISRWYDVEIVYEDPSVKILPFGGSISKFEKISKVLNMLELADGRVKFEIKGRKIIASKK